MCAIRGGEDERWSATWTGAAAESVKGVGHRAPPVAGCGLLAPRDARGRRGSKRPAGSGRPLRLVHSTTVPSVSVGRGSGGSIGPACASRLWLAFGHNC